MNLNGLHGLVIGVANQHSIAWGCAKAYAGAGARLTMTYQNAKALAHVAPLAESIGATLVELDVRNPAQWDALFEPLEALDFALHAIAFAPKADLHGPLVNASLDGFSMAMEVSCYSLIELARRARPHMTQGGAITTLSYYGAQRVVPNYQLMGPVKAALEASVRQLSVDLGADAIRVNALSPGPIATRAASGLAHFDELMAIAAKNAPLGELTTIDDVGQFATFLASPSARHVTGQTLYVDAGYCIRD
ncbi:enoyl-ACP reductase FabI [Litorivicinus lipolyticus]|uniref:Enoyl-[acyl-carrier-protein] reductase [NADH] FabI n=1 Tax=Litorivicinus lipolyticus TaxID=418701 RepID=A0A5Q2QCQ6_9GAMM|nr:enoyl-ACP reductase FabI [Litorivicinus lipolyticus]QGG79620.1 enoyl-ACP reductase FabI [Litorivicinus lipolyticus]